MPTLPTILRKQRRAGIEIGERRSVGRGSFGTLARDQIELGELIPFLSLAD